MVLRLLSGKIVMVIIGIGSVNEDSGGADGVCKDGGDNGGDFHSADWYS